jgi:Ca2+:H+ antiporter
LFGQEGEGENNEAEEEAVIGFWSAFAWLAGMTVFIALLSEYVVDTIQVILLKCLELVWNYFQ